MILALVSCASAFSSAATAAEGHCQLPGVPVVIDLPDDQIGTAQQDIRSVSIAELYQIAGNKLFLTMNVGNLSPLPQPASRWIIFFTRTNGSGQATEWFVAMATDSPASATDPAYIYGHTTGSGASRQLVIDGSADGGAFSFDGRITIGLSTPTPANGGMTFPSLVTGETLSKIEGLTQTMVAGQGISADTTGTGTYQLKGNLSCAPSPTPTPTPSATVPPTPVVASFPHAVTRLAVDPVRPRVYGTVTSSNTVIVIDTQSFNVLRIIPVGSSPRGLTVSADGAKLWVANSGSTSAAVGVIDLETLLPLPSLAAPVKPHDIEEGLSRRLYLTPVEQSSSHRIMQINAESGAYEGSLGEFEVYKNGMLETSPDRTHLFFGNAGLGISTMDKFDISTTQAALVQKHHFYEGGNGTGLAIKHDGTSIVYPNGGGNGEGYDTFKIPTADISKVDGSFEVGGYPGPATFSNDDSLLYHVRDSESVVYVFDTQTFARVGSIFLGESPQSSGGYHVRDLVVDNSGQWLFTSVFDDLGNSADGELRVYATDRVDPVKPRPAPMPIGQATPTPTPTATPTPGASATPPAQSQNLSTRLNVLPGDNVMIGGFIISGNTPKKLIIRAVGPSVPIQGRLDDPTLELHRPDGTTTTNNNWKSRDFTHESQEDEVRATGLAPSDDRESALVETLVPGAYTAVVRGNNGGTGIGLVEVYDLDSAAESQLANIATRGFVETGNNVMIGGFIVGPPNAPNTKVVVRAIGPSVPVGGTLQDPELELHDGNGAMTATNDNWQDDPSAAEIESHNLDPIDSRESALLRSLSPGAYTAIVRGKNGGTGIGLVEVYNLR